MLFLVFTIYTLFFELIYFMTLHTTFKLHFFFPWELYNYKKDTQLYTSVSHSINSTPEYQHNSA